MHYFAPPPHLHTHTLMSCPWCIPNIHGYSKFALILNTLIDSNNFCRAIYNRELWNGSFYKTLCAVEARVLAITKLIFVHLLISDFFSNERSLFLCLRFIFFYKFIIDFIFFLRGNNDANSGSTLRQL